MSPVEDFVGLDELAQLVDEVLEQGMHIVECGPSNSHSGAFKEAWAQLERYAGLIQRYDRGKTLPHADIRKRQTGEAKRCPGLLILGERGCGKGFFARKLATLIPGDRGTLVTVNCSAVSTGLFQAEMFGHVKGSFTGAHENRAGKFDAAHEKILFLDEVGELSLDEQRALNDAIQSGRTQGVGGRTQNVDLVVVAATLRDLDDEVAAGRFNSDFRDRFAFKIHIPSLAERRRDIPRLLQNSFADFGPFVGWQGFSLKLNMHEEALHRFVNYSWPGNVRELENTVWELLSRWETVPNERIDVSDLPESLRRAAVVETQRSFSEEEIVSLLRSKSLNLVSEETGLPVSELKEIRARNGIRFKPGGPGLKRARRSSA